MTIEEREAGRDGNEELRRELERFHELRGIDMRRTLTAAEEVEMMIITSRWIRDGDISELDELAANLSEDDSDE